MILREHVMTCVILFVGVLSLTLHCSLLGLDSEDDDDDTTTLALLFAASSACTGTAATTNQFTGCAAGAVNEVSYTAEGGGKPCVTSIAADVPCWIRQNFHCITATVSGSNIVIQTNNFPPYRSPYYANPGPYSAYHEAAFPAGHAANPNSIASQNITFTIPSSPTPRTCSYDSTAGAGIDALGVNVHGVVMFNNQAAPGDSLETEYLTMDDTEGHPESTGKYHVHTEPAKITNDDSVLVGIMLDGYPLYGKRAEDNSYPTLDATTHTRSCTTTLFPNGTYCYHVGNGTGTAGYLIGSYFKGVRGTVN